MEYLNKKAEAAESLGERGTKSSYSQDCVSFIENWVT